MVGGVHVCVGGEGEVGSIDEVNREIGRKSMWTTVCTGGGVYVCMWWWWGGVLGVHGLPFRLACAPKCPFYQAFK